MYKKISTFSFFGLATAAFIFSSCTKKSDKTQEEQLVGKWTMDAAIGAYGYEGEINRDTTYFTEGEFIQFNTDGTLHAEQGEEVIDGHWEITNNKLVITDTEYMDYPGGFTISELSASKLELYYAQTQGQTSLEQKLKLKK
jgi:hypothetical protein